MPCSAARDAPVDLLALRMFGLVVRTCVFRPPQVQPHRSNKGPRSAKKPYVRSFQPILGRDLLEVSASPDCRQRAGRLEVFVGPWAGYSADAFGLGSPN